jgi:hypothetical protein
MNTSAEFKEILQEIVKDKLENVIGMSLTDKDITVNRGRETTGDGRWTGQYNNKGYIESIKYMNNLNNKNFPNELINAIIRAYGEAGIEKPTISVDQLMDSLDNQEITKVEACQQLGQMLEETKIFMTKNYTRENGTVNKFIEKTSSYDNAKDSQVSRDEEK